MSRRIVMGPFNRVEGDLEVSLDVDAGIVLAARVNAPLFRGFELMLAARPASDALVIVPRICGICSVAQSAAAAAALAHAAGLEAPENGRRARHLIQATENLADHLSHFYLFFMPDFARAAYAGAPWYPAAAERFTAMHGSASQEVLAARGDFLKLMGFLAGKWPHTLALQPGGTTRAIGSGERIRMLALLREFRRFLEKTLFGDTLEAVAALPDEAALIAWMDGRHSDFAAFLRMAYALGLERIGEGSLLFMASGAYDELPAGLRSRGQAQLSALDPNAIVEHTQSAWLADGPPLPPRRGETRIAADKPGAYTWCKAPRYADQVVEVGALARQFVAAQPLVSDLVTRHGGSVTARVVARLIEMARILPRMESWCHELKADAPFCHHRELPNEGEGIGLVEAARGTLGHWLSFSRGRIDRYQIIAPTTWNFSPRDQQQHPGPLETALVGLPAGEGTLPTVQHVVRSFDPCMVCTVH